MTSEREEFMITAFTSEARNFLHSFRWFCAGTQGRVASVDLVECLEDIIEEFGRYIEQPEIIDRSYDGQIVALETQFPKNYKCITCGVNLKFAADVDTHMKSAMHRARSQPLPITENKDNKENVPKAKNGLSRREERNRNRKKERENKFRQNKEEKEKLQVEKRVKQFLAKPLDKVCKDAIAEGKALRNYDKHNKVRDDILKLITPQYPEAKVHFFGSRLNGLGSKDSDIDVFLELEKPINQCFELPNIGLYIDQLVKLMQKEKTTWTSLHPIKMAKVPILQARYSPESIECDISFSNPFGVYNTQLINHMLEMQPLCYKMCVLMKNVYKFSQIKKDGKTFSTYSMILMVIFFLQTEKLLPPIKNLLCEQEGDAGKIGPWTVTFLQTSLKDLGLKRECDKIETVKQYLNKMFIFYLNFAYKKNIISPYLGAVVSTGSFVSNMERTMPNYFKCLKAGKCDALVFTELTLQDPLILNMNVTKNVSQDKLIEIMDLFLFVSKELSQLESTEPVTAPVANKSSVSK